MNPSYKKDKDKDYMILEGPGKPEGSEYQIRMLLVNRISGLLECKMRKIDGMIEFYYDITECQPMTKAFERQMMGKKDMEVLLSGLEEAMDEAGRYLLDMEQFVLKPEFIFRNTDTGKFGFCYLPFYDGNLEADFRELAEYILKRLDHSQEEAVLWGYDIYSRSVEEHFSIGKLLESFHERTARELAKQSQGQKKETQEPEYVEYEEQLPKGEKISEAVPQTEYYREGHRSENTERTLHEKKPLNKKSPEKKIKKVRSKKRKRKSSGDRMRAGVRKSIGRAAGILAGMAVSLAVAAWAVWCQGLNFIQAGGILFSCMGLLVYFTAVFRKKPGKQRDRLEEEISQWELSEGEERDKTVLMEKLLPESYPVLVSIEPEKQANLVLDQPNMTVGKQKGQVDLFLSNPSVSRIHAVIGKEKDGWYLKDCGSTNGTFVNGERLNGDGKKRLENGAELRFSSVRFYFHCSDGKATHGISISSD